MSLRQAQKPPLERAKPGSGPRLIEGLSLPTGRNER